MVLPLPMLPATIDPRPAGRTSVRCWADRTSPGCLPPSEETTPPMATQTTREELYRQVWSRPVMQVAADYGVSNVALKKICRKHGIPVPGRGYWARKAVGKPVESPPGLAAAEPGQPIIIRGHRGAELPEAVRDAQRRARVRERPAEHRVVVDTAPKDLHRVVAENWDALDQVKHCAIGLVAEAGPAAFSVAIAREWGTRAMVF